MSTLYSILLILLTLQVSAGTLEDDINLSEYKTLKTYRTPTVRVENKEWPSIKDNLQFQDMNQAIEGQMRKFFRVKLTSSIRLGRDTYSTKILPASLLAFQKYMFLATDCLQLSISTQEEEACYQEFTQNLQDNFYLYKPEEQDSRGGSLFTGYYTPTIAATRSPEGNSQWGIYRKPAEADLAGLSRNEIDFERKLINSPYSVGFSEDLFKNYLLHIEGGGRLEFTEPDGSKSYQYISYDGTNSQSFRFISKYMMEKSYISNGSIRSQRDFLETNPQLWEEIYGYCPSYVYFKPTDHAPFGNDGVPMVNARAIATDRKLYSLKGLIAFITTPTPYDFDEEGKLLYKEFQRFMIDHDTGGAIKGSARADLFFGEDDEAEFMASYMMKRGGMFFLSLKPEKANTWIRIFEKMKDLESL